MPVLANSRHEIFAQELAKGKTQVDAYTIAGFKPNDGHAARLAGDGRIIARVGELLERAAERTVCTIYDIAEQLDEDRLFARELENAGAAISATMGKAKVLGLLTEKVEHTGANGEAIKFEQVQNDADAFRRAVVGLAARAGEAGADSGAVH